MSAASRRTGMSWPALIGVTIGAIIMAAPLVWTLLLSLKNSAELMRPLGSLRVGSSVECTYHSMLGNSGSWPRWAAA